jgi:tetratricopeptide (TPR) repeat protein
MFMLGLASKSMLVTLPCVLLLLDFWPLRRWQPQQLFATVEEQQQPAEQPKQSPSRFAPQTLGWLVVEKLPLFALAAIVSTIVAIGQHSMGCMSMTDNITFEYRIANAAFSAAAYLWKMVLPINVFQSIQQKWLVCDLAVFYPHLAVMGDAAKARLLWYGLAGGLVLIAITLFVLVNLRRRPYLAVGWFWYLGALVPVIGLIQVGAQGMADRYTYLPMIGVYIMIVWAGAELATRSPELRRGIVIAAGIMLTAWTALAFVQVSTWKNSETVFQHAIDVIPDNFFAYNHLGLAYQSGIDLHHPLSPADQEKVNKATYCYKEAVRLGPSYDAANANLGVACLNAKQFDKAIECFEKAVKVNPYAAFHHANLAGAYGTKSRFDEAAVELKEALRIEPNAAHYHQSLAVVYLRQQKLKQAIAELEEVLRLSPMDYGTMRDLAWFLSTSPDASVRNGARAVELGEKAAMITHRSEPFTLHALAAAYAETGQFDKAVETAMESARLAAQQGNQPLLETLRNLIRRYSSGQPYREPLPPPPPTGNAPPTDIPLSEGTAPTKSNTPPQVESERKSL